MPQQNAVWHVSYWFAESCVMQFTFVIIGWIKALPIETLINIVRWKVYWCSDSYLIVVINRYSHHFDLQKRLWLLFMLRLVQITQAIFCLVSMILTSLFALSLSSVTVDALPDQEGWGKAVFLAVLFILIGCCIDIGKYLFWSQRQRSRYYGMLSLVLMVFSWLASCAFLVTSEHDLVRESQVRSDQYIALQLRIESTRQAIAFHERLLEKRQCS